MGNIKSNIPLSNIYMLDRIITVFTLKLFVSKTHEFKSRYVDGYFLFDIILLISIIKNLIMHQPLKCPKRQTQIFCILFLFFLLVYTHIHTLTAEVEKNKTMCRCETPNVWGSTPSDVYISRHYEMPLRAKRKKLSFFESLEVN